MIRIYRAPWSTNVERVALALAHKGLEVESVVIDYSDRTEVRRVSGQDLVPVIERDGIVVSGSLAILRHLEELRPDPPLFPADRSRRAELDLFLDWFDHMWKVAPNAIEAELAQAPPAAARIAELSATMQAHLDLFERLLTGREYLLGGSLTAGDLAAFPFLKYASRRDPADDEAFHRVLADHQSLGPARPRVSAWIERVDRLPRA